MKLLILSLFLAQIQEPFQIVKQGGNVYLVPQGIIKTGPRSYSMADPKNPYREPRASILTPPQRSYLDMSQPRQRVFPNLRPLGKTLVIENPFAK